VVVNESDAGGFAADNAAQESVDEKAAAFLASMGGKLKSSGEYAEVKAAKPVKAKKPKEGGKKGEADDDQATAQQQKTDKPVLRQARREEKTTAYRKQGEYGARKFIKP
jgi:hypothetical protein